MPAASSRMRAAVRRAWRRSCSPMRPWLTRAGELRAGRGIGEQQLHVARAHLAAVDAVGRALAALDAAHHLELVVRR